MKMVIFADDTNLFCSGQDPYRVMLNVETDLKYLTKWFEQIGPFFLMKQKCSPEMEQVHKTKFLGIIIVTLVGNHIYNMSRKLYY